MDQPRLLSQVIPLPSRGVGNWDDTNKKKKTLKRKSSIKTSLYSLSTTACEKSAVSTNRLEGDVQIRHCDQTRHYDVGREACD